MVTVTDYGCGLVQIYTQEFHEWSPFVGMVLLVASSKMIDDSATNLSFINPIFSHTTIWLFNIAMERSTHF